MLCLSLVAFGQQAHNSHLDSVIHSSVRSDSAGVLVVDDSGKAKIVQPEIVVNNIYDLKGGDNDSHGIWGLVKSYAIVWVILLVLIIFLLLRFVVQKRNR